MPARVVIGALPGGGFGMRSSLPGVNVLTATPRNGAQLSFDTGWANIARVVQTGISSVASPHGTFVSIVDQGFKPAFEMRTLSGSTVYDDRNLSGMAGALSANANAISGSMPSNTQIRADANLNDMSFSFFYLVYNVPAGV